MFARENVDPVALAERHLRIFAKSSNIFADYAYHAMNLGGCLIDDVLVFGVDVGSDWALLFPEPPEDLFTENDLSGQKLALLCGTVERLPFAKILEEINLTLASMVRSPHCDPKLVKCIIMDLDGVTVHHVEPAPLEERPQYLN